MSEAAGRLERIWVKRFHGGPMDAVESVRLVAGEGIVDNADQGGKRQVTMVSSESWADALEEAGLAAPGPVARRANLLLSGIDLAHSRGRTLVVGRVSIQVNGETVPCRLMEETAAGLQGALARDWRGGVFGQVLIDGSLRVGDEVRWRDP